MKIYIIILFASALASCSAQSTYDRKQDIKINQSIADIISLNAKVTSLKIDSAVKTAQIRSLILDTIAQARQIKSLRDSIVLLSGSDFNVDTGTKRVTIPQLAKLPLIESRLTKLEAKP